MAPLIKGQVMATRLGRNAGVEVFGISFENLLTLPRIARPESYAGDINRFQSGVAIGSGVARELGVIVGDKIKLMSPDGVKTAFGTSPRINAYEVTYIFSAGRYDIDRTRIYLPLAEAQSFFNREAVVDEIEVMVQEPEALDRYIPDILKTAGERAQIWTWRDASGGFLRALEVEDNVMFIILSILVLIAAMNIVSGLIMLVKNKGRDIGILRTIGLSQGSVLRVFFICGAATGTAGTVLGILLGVIFAHNIAGVYSFVDWVTGSGVQDLEARGFFFPSAVVTAGDLAAAAALSLGLSWLITLFPARRAARMNPVEALRYE